MGSRAYVDAEHGQQSWYPIQEPRQNSGGRSEDDVRVDAAKVQEGVGSGVHVDAKYSQQSQ